MSGRGEWRGLLVALAALIAAFSLLTNHFFSWTTLLALANQAPEGLLLATGMTLVVITGGIDLSVGSVLALAAAVAGLVLIEWQSPLIVAAAAALGVGVACGWVNGWLSTRWQLPSFIATLAMLEMARGATYLVSESQTRYLGARVDILGAEVFAGLRVPVLVAILVVVAAHLLTRPRPV